MGQVEHRRTSFLGCLGAGESLMDSLDSPTWALAAGAAEQLKLALVPA